MDPLFKKSLKSP